MCRDVGSKSLIMRFTLFDFREKMISGRKIGLYTHLVSSSLIYISIWKVEQK